jgi:hypothetical protein
MEFLEALTFSTVLLFSHFEFKNDNIDTEDLTALRAVRDELTVHSDNILLRDHRIILPKVLQDRAIYVALEGHQGNCCLQSWTIYGRIAYFIQFYCSRQ